MADNTADDIQWEPTGEEDQDSSNHVADDPDDFLEIIEDKDNPFEQKDADKKPDLNEEDEEDKNKPDPRFQKRINQMTHRQRQAEEKVETANKENEVLRKRLDDLETGISTQRRDDFKQDYDQVKKDLFKAAEDGDTQRQVDLTEKMADMRAAARVAEMNQKTRTNQQQDDQSQQQDQSRSPEPPKEALNWWNRNRWFNSSEHAGETGFAKGIDSQLEAEGYDNQTPEYYEELDNRLQKHFPALYKGTEKKKPKPATAPTGGQQRKASPKDGRIRMTKTELQIANELGLTSEVQLREFAKERAILAKKDAQ